jgi:hypothetical protein
MARLICFEALDAVSNGEPATASRRLIWQNKVYVLQPTDTSMETDSVAWRLSLTRKKRT